MSYQVIESSSYRAIKASRHGGIELSRRRPSQPSQSSQSSQPSQPNRQASRAIGPSRLTVCVGGAGPKKELGLSAASPMNLMGPRVQGQRGQGRERQRRYMPCRLTFLYHSFPSGVPDDLFKNFEATDQTLFPGRRCRNCAFPPEPLFVHGLRKHETPYQTHTQTERQRQTNRHRQTD